VRGRRASSGACVESLLKTLQGFGIGRVAALAGGAAGVAAILLAIMLRMGGPPMSLLYSNLDLKEAGQITSALDASGIKYEVKGDGSTLFVDRDKVASARLMLSGKGLPTSGSVGYEIFDNAPALGQTDFVQNLNAKRATEGELARTIRSIQGVQSARVLLNMPKKQLFEDDVQSPSASIMLVTGGRRLGQDQVRAIRNLVAAGVPDLKPERVAIADQSGDLLAGMGDAAGSGGDTAAKNDTEEHLRKTIKDLVEGVVGPGKARVTVSAEVDESQVTTQDEKYDPDGQVVRSTHTNSNNAKENKPGSSAAVSAAQNVPGQTTTPGADTASQTTGTDEVTNYEISHTTTTTVAPAGRIKKLSVAVAVDGVTPLDAKGKPGTYSPRSAEEMSRIQDLVRSAMGFDKERGDQLSVVNVRFDHAADTGEGVSAASPFNFDKNDIMRVAELGVMLVVAGLLIFFVARPMMKGAAGGGAILPMLAGRGPAPGAAPVYASDGASIAYDPQTGQTLLPAPNGFDQKIDIARIEGQVSGSSVKKVADFVEKHPDESIAILRSWLHEA
jgi:flagellar M-ring protein FliF